MKGLVQAELFAEDRGMDIDEVTAFLNAGAPRSVAVTLTRNRVSMISVEFSGAGAVQVRMQEAFLKAPLPVLRALRRYLRSNRRADWRMVASFAGTITVADKRPARQRRMKTAGAVYDLKSVFADVNRNFFSGRLSCHIGWGQKRNRGARRRRARSIRFGSWNATTRTIRIHPLLDDGRVPYEFVRYIVFHEMLHIVTPETLKDCRRYDHTREFRVLERSFPNLQEMKRISKRLVATLI